MRTIKSLAIIALTLLGLTVSTLVGEELTEGKTTAEPRSGERQPGPLPPEAVENPPISDDDSRDCVSITLPGVSTFAIRSAGEHRIFLRIAPSDWTHYARRLDLWVAKGTITKSPEGKPSFSLGHGLGTQSSWYALPRSVDKSYYLSGIWANAGWWEAGALKIVTKDFDNGKLYRVRFAHSGHVYTEFQQFCVEVFVETIR